MRTPLRPLAVLVASAAVITQGCASRAGTGSALPAPIDPAGQIRSANAVKQIGTPPTALKIVAPVDKWTWINVPQSNCDDGSTTGIGVNPGTGPDLVVFFDAGGACWDATTCLVENTALHGPVGATQFENSLPNLKNTILDRSLPNNPFATATLVEIPYCTGDLHAGSNIATYVDPKGVAHAYHHTGYLNSLAFLQRIAATWPVVNRLVIAGSSAGGFGALLNYETYRQKIVALQYDLIDDSGPPLPNGALAASIEADLFKNWKLADVTNPICDCTKGFEPALATLVKRYPNDRMSLLESEQDGTMRAYFQLSGAQFQTELNKTASDVMAGSYNARFFFVPGTTHMMLPDPTLFSENLPLVTWLKDQYTDSRSWDDESPTTSNAPPPKSTPNPLGFLI
ncbi:MAG TPA: pectin acetylesterase-family hydrolase [Candidatus Baltobacteraceae bacterium]|nr:pectin acetylesterase-family hydrolase [Candidatus Baltobacteraceae bacterium]